MTLLEVRDLHITFPTPLGKIRACNGVSFTVDEGEVLGIVGESGSGKTVAALSVLGLVPPPGRIESGSIRFQGEELLGAPPKRLREIRGKHIGMVFQDAGRALDPVHTVASHLREAGASGESATVALERVGLHTSLLRSYPHELSGGQRQRVMIAMAIARNPPLLIADEPTTAVDSLSQAQVLRELARIQKELGCALIIISHNLGLVSRMADRILVMYLGTVLEENSVYAFCRSPLHPYSRGLLSATPQGAGAQRLQGVPGQPGRMTQVPSGCVFHPRCAYASEVCLRDVPPFRRFQMAKAACHRLDEEGRLP